VTALHSGHRPPNDPSSLEGGTWPRGFSRGRVSGWPLQRASELFRLQYGAGLVESSRSRGKVPVYGTNGRCGWHDTANVKGPGVVLGRKGMGPLGVEWSPTDFWVIDTAYYLEPIAENIDLKFYYYLIKFIGLNHLKDGTSNPTLSRDSFGRQLFPRPPLAEQRAIASVLGLLDDRIDLDRRVNQTLEQAALALFKAWFVDFEPVRAKSEGRWKRGEALPGMPASTWDLWPSRFEDSELGEIPEQWHTASLGGPEFPLVGPGIDSGGGEPLHYIATGDVDRGTILGETVGTPASLPSRANMRPGNGRVWFAKMKASPKHLWTMKEHENWWSHRVLSTGFTGVQAVNPNCESSLYCFVSSPAFDSTKDLLATGTTMQALNNVSIRTISMAIPDNAIAQEFDHLVRPIYLKFWQNAFESWTISSIRNALLPKLLSGEVRVPLELGR
jgi:type I restriction enzyme, S subunit